jgi:hypothetical protein
MGSPQASPAFYGGQRDLESRPRPEGSPGHSVINCKGSHRQEVLSPFVGPSKSRWTMKSGLFIAEGPAKELSRVAIVLPGLPTHNLATSLIGFCSVLL